ncbi:DUF1684 domain-containing protein [Belliella aquatica]|uniref:DUF1684 domain-containing protein n=1 Tax=Belliella aquatica TaxID=1323734 RepID=A0ABQ1M2Z9_9BACT|nr:DUF1684 domain-containing protein [Belliella aquatica]MCH7404823.1 DUF1684 domain-containing protein [Belliella aquatica]GGC33900.1 hypothetical protein GCM10010993_10940 [Belliella aquatica]
MSTKNILLTIVTVIALAAVIYTLTKADDPEVYIEKIEKEREKQFKFLRFNPESPLDAEQKNNLGALSFYPIDPAFKVRARLVPAEDRKVITIPMTDGSEEKYIKHSYAEFDLKGAPQRLLLLQGMNEIDKRNFFLAFADSTSGLDTYGGGRYLNLRQDGKNSVSIDFNLAYNPYCAYNPDFACPLPPRENLMELGILAGEKDYKKE